MEVKISSEFMAERQGFEPWKGISLTRFPGVRLKPLGHLSVILCPVFCRTGSPNVCGERPKEKRNRK